MSTSKKKKIARSDAEKNEVRVKILTVARAFVLKNGYAALSIRKLATAIGYAPGTIYLYFASRDEIVREIGCDGFADLYEEMKAAAKVTDPLKRLAVLLQAFADFAFENPDAYRLSFMEDPKFTAHIFRNAPLDDKGPGWQAFMLFVDAVKDLKKSRKLPLEANEILLAEVLWTGIHGVVSAKLLYPAFPASNGRQMVDKMIEILLGGICPSTLSA